MYKRTSLPNGLRIVTHDIKDRDSISLGLWVGVGGRYEEDKIKGAAHFLEHIVFKGSKKYGCEEIKEKIEGVGGALNAFTSEEQTCYYAKIPSKHLDQTFDVLADMVFHPIIAAKDVAKESGVIIEEIKMYHDLPQYQVLEILDELLWPDHPLGKNLAGTIETVGNMRNKDLLAFHNRYYTPSNIVIAACGRLSHEKILDLARKKLKSVSESKPHSYLPVEKPLQRPQARYFHKDIEQMHLALGMHGYDEYDENRYALNLLSVIMGGNMSSRLFVEVREKRGLAYSIGTSTKSLHDTGLFMVRAGVDNKKIVDATALIIKELEKVRKQGVRKDEFMRAKDYLLGQLLLGLEDTMEHMLWIGESVISKDEIKTLQNIIVRFEKLTPEDLKRVAQEILDQNRFSLAIVGPISEEQKKDLNSLLSIKS